MNQYQIKVRILFHWILDVLWEIIANQKRLTGLLRIKNLTAMNGTKLGHPVKSLTGVEIICVFVNTSAFADF